MNPSDERCAPAVRAIAQDTIAAKNNLPCISILRSTPAESRCRDACMVSETSQGSASRPSPNCGRPCGSTQNRPENHAFAELLDGSEKVTGDATGASAEIDPRDEHN